MSVNAPAGRGHPEADRIRIEASSESADQDAGKKCRQKNSGASRTGSGWRLKTRVLATSLQRIISTVPCQGYTHETRMNWKKSRNTLTMFHVIIPMKITLKTPFMPRQSRLIVINFISLLTDHAI